MNMEASPKIVILGAGLSGLTCAYRLEQSGLHPEVYEARSRPGGRVLTVTVDGHLCELGAQNIFDGGDAKKLLSLADELGLEVEYDSRTLHPKYDAVDDVIDIHERLRQLHFDPDKLLQDLEDYSNTCSNLEEVIAEIFSNDKLLFKTFKVILSAYEGAPIRTQSAKAYDTLYYMLLGGLSTTHQTKKVEHCWIKGGNSLLANKLAEPLNIHYHHVLKAVKSTPQGGYLLTFENGQEVHCDILALSIPPPTYADIDIEESVLPQERKEKIESINYGTNCKIVVPLNEE